MPRICITVADETPQPYNIPLDTMVVSIGRAHSNDVVIDNSSVSSKHCEMMRTETGYVLVDAQSTNGIHLNGLQLEAIELTNGMTVLVGDVPLNFQLTREEQQAFGGQNLERQQQQERQVAVTPPAAMAASRPVLASRQKNGGRDFALFLTFVLLASFAFWLGLGKAHKSATKTEADPYGSSLLEDIRSK